MVRIRVMVRVRLYLLIVNDKFCNVHNVFNTVVREKQC